MKAKVERVAIAIDILVRPEIPLRKHQYEYGFDLLLSGKGGIFLWLTTIWKFNGKNYFTWRWKMETQLRALGQWEVVTGVLRAPTPIDDQRITPDEARLIEAWSLRAARAYAEIALRVDDDYGEVIAAITDPRAAWTMLETSYGSQQSGIQSVVNAELTLAKWDGIKMQTD